LGLEPKPLLTLTHKKIHVYEANTPITVKITGVSEGIKPALRITRIIPASAGQSISLEVIEKSIGEEGYRVVAEESIPRDIILAAVLGDIILDFKTVRFTPKRNSNAATAC
jgi:hypothetical protein